MMARLALALCLLCALQWPMVQAQQPLDQDPAAHGNPNLAPRNGNPLHANNPCPAVVFHRPAPTHYARTSEPHIFEAAEVTVAENLPDSLVKGAASLDVDPGPSVGSLISQAQASGRMLPPTLLRAGTNDVLNFVGNLSLAPDMINPAITMISTLVNNSLEGSYAAQILSREASSAQLHSVLVSTVRVPLKKKKRNSESQSDPKQDDESGALAYAVVLESTGSLIQQYEQYVDQWTECCGFCCCLKHCTQTEVKTRPRGNTPVELLVIMNKLRQLQYQRLPSLLQTLSAGASAQVSMSFGVV